MLAFDYKPPPVLVPTMEFKDSYRTAAKQLWLQQMAASGGRLGAEEDESEVEMPAAVAYAIGTEDRPHYDEVRTTAGDGVCLMVGVGYSEWSGRPLCFHNAIQALLLVLLPPRGAETKLAALTCARHELLPAHSRV